MDAMAAKEYGIIDKIVDKSAFTGRDMLKGSDVSSLSRGLG